MKYYAVIDNSVIEITRLEYNYNGHFWLCNAIDGKGYDCDIVYTIKDDELVIVEAPKDVDEGGDGRPVIYVSEGV